jgi:hypothetical protein
MRAERNIYTMMAAIKEERVPDGHYGPKTMRWGTDEERKAFKLDDFPVGASRGAFRSRCAIYSGSA